MADMAELTIVRSLTTENASEAKFQASEPYFY